MRIGYARVSTVDQNSQLQVTALKAASCDKIFEEQASAAAGQTREQLEAALEFVRSGDTLVITRIDRLARSLRDLQNIVHDLQERSVNLEAIEQPIDTSNAAGKAFLDMLGVFAEFETNLRRERQAEGIAAAKQRGVYKGRKPVAEEKLVELKRLRELGVSTAEACRQVGVSRTAAYKHLGRNG
jgi:DNA invertase Pin-like site-specific DNA recombinase